MLTSPDFFFKEANLSILGSYLLTSYRNALNAVLKMFLYLEIFGSNTAYECLNHTAWPMRNCVTVEFTIYGRKR